MSNIDIIRQGGQGGTHCVCVAPTTLLPNDNRVHLHGQHVLQGQWGQIRQFQVVARPSLGEPTHGQAIDCGCVGLEHMLAVCPFPAARGWAQCHLVCPC